VKDNDASLKEEVDVTLQVSKDSKVITLVLTSPDPFTVQSFLTELETYLHEISLAADQRGAVKEMN
jgi:hypothetical protein